MAGLIGLTLTGSCSTVPPPSPQLASAPRAASVRIGPVAPTALSARMIAELANVSPPMPLTDAVVASAELPPVTSAGPAARSLRLSGRDAVTSARAQLCLATALYYEADSESDDGERAVAQVVLNRVRHPAFPASVCGVVYQGSETPGRCQFTFACDGSMARRRISAGGWARASRIAAAALSGGVFAQVGLAINYHTLAVAPRWSPLLVPAAVIGAHIFYRLDGPAGAPAVFGRAYARAEPLPGPHMQLVASPATSSPASPVPSAPITISPRPSAGFAASASSVPIPITSDDQILPRWRDSGKWIAE